MIYGLSLFDKIDKAEKSDKHLIELSALVEALPGNQKSTAFRKLSGFDSDWTRTDYILADLWDVTIANAMGGSKKKPPIYPRPGTREYYKNGKSPKVYTPEKTKARKDHLLSLLKKQE